MCNRSCNQSLLQCRNSNREHNFVFIFSDYRMRVAHPNKSRVLACLHRNNSKPLHYLSSLCHVHVVTEGCVKGSGFECPYFNRDRRGTYMQGEDKGPIEDLAQRKSLRETILWPSSGDAITKNGCEMTPLL